MGDGVMTYRLTFSPPDDADGQFIGPDGERVKPVIGAPTPGVDMTLERAIILWDELIQRHGGTWCVETNSSRFADARWINAYCNDGYVISIHWPDGASDRVKRCIAALVNCRGL